MKTAEHLRLEEALQEKTLWKKWGPYLSERQWGTVREDYSDNGDAWNYFTHDQARSRAYRWGEDGLAGISDDHQVLCFALALWNGKDPILKERLFGLTNSEGNHGEDVKEYYFYLDSTPTHSYMKYLYKYPQAAYPYADLVDTNRGRSRTEVGIRAARHRRVRPRIATSMSLSSTRRNRPTTCSSRSPSATAGKRAASLHLLPTLWFRNTWSWPKGGPKPVLKSVKGSKCSVIHAHHTDPLFQESLDDYYLYCEGDGSSALYRKRDQSTQRLFGRTNRTPYVKDGINNFRRARAAGCGESRSSGRRRRHTIN